MRHPRAAVVAAALLVAAGLAARWLAPDERTSPAGPDGAGPGAERAMPAAWWPAAAGTAGAAAPPLHEAAAPSVAQRGLLPGASAPAAPADAPRAWEAVETALRPAALGPDLAGPVSDGLEEARAGMQHCFDEEARRPSRPRRTAASRPPAFGPAVLVLRLEATPGRLAVAEVEVVSEGTSSPELVECARRALAAFEFAVPGVKPPERYRVRMTLM